MLPWPQLAAVVEVVVEVEEAATEARVAEVVAATGARAELDTAARGEGGRGWDRLIEHLWGSRTDWDRCKRVS